MLTKFKLIVATTALAVGGLSGFAFAKGHMGPKKALIEKFDTNKDGKLDDTEKAALKAERLAKIDVNKDGKVDDAERQLMHDKRVEERFAMLDANKDGAITLAEMKAAKPHGKHGRGRGHHHRFGGAKTK